MTAEVFEKYLKELNVQMQSEKRKILLFLDNASSHPNLQFSNVKLVFLPPCTTSKLQPLDAGIIANFKVHYRSWMLKYLLTQMEICNTVTELTKKSRYWTQFNLRSGHVEKFLPLQS